MIEPRVHATLAPPSPDDELVTTGIGPTGDLVALWKSAAGSRITGHGSVIEVKPEIQHPIVQPLPDGRVLVVGARCKWSPDGVDPNALVFDQAGQVVASAVFGDGIQHVATTPSGQTWVGYFDEGILGNLGWGFEPGPAPIGAHGLVRFDENLDLAWEYPDDTPFDVIEDCYALNVAGEVVWACYYGDFPVVRIDAGQVAGWTTVEAHGPDALITDGRHCVLVCAGGDYHGEVGELSSDGEFTVVGETAIALPEGPVSLSGRGDTLHIVTGRTHYKVDLDQLMRPAGP